MNKIIILLLVFWVSNTINAQDNGVLLFSQTGLAGTAKSQKTFEFNLPNGMNSLKLVGTIRSGNVALYVGYGKAPSTAGQGVSLGKSGTATLSNLSPGKYVVLIVGATSFSGFNFAFYGYGNPVNENFLWDVATNSYIKPVKGQKIWITAEPRMPLTAALNWISGVPQKTPTITQWKWVSKFDGFTSGAFVLPGHEASSRTFPVKGVQNVAYGTYLDAGKIWFGNDFFGGTVILTGSNDSMGSAKTLELEIRGKNPKDADVDKFLKTLSPPWYTYAQLAHESKRGNTIYNNFYPTGWKGLGASGTQGVVTEGLPTWGYPVGRGLGQLDFSSEKKDVSAMELWNWKANIARSVKIMAEKRKIAVDVFANIKKTYPKEWEEPPVPKQFVKYLPATATGIDIASIQGYNGFAKWTDAKNNTRYFSYEFVPGASKGNRWIFHENSNGYVQKFVDQYTSKDKLVDG